MSHVKSLLGERPDAFQRSRLAYVLRAHLGEFGGRMAAACEQDAADADAEAEQARTLLLAQAGESKEAAQG